MTHRPEVTGGKPDGERDAYSIAEFCQRHGLSVATFYKFRKRMPPTFRIGTRILISREAAAAWRQRETVATA